MGLPLKRFKIGKSCIGKSKSRNLKLDRKPVPVPLVQFKLSPFGFSNAGLADFKFLLLPPEPLYLAVPLSNVATVPHMTENDEP